MIKPYDTVISDLRLLFDIDNNKLSYEKDGKFGIHKQHMFREDVLKILTDYFSDGTQIENGYLSVDGITLLYTTFQVIKQPKDTQ